MADTSPISSQTVQALQDLIEVCPRLAFKDAFIARLRDMTTNRVEASRVRETLDIILVVADQNVRVAQKYDYVRLENSANDVIKAAKFAIDTLG